jgi:hypothetical protein
MEDWEGGQGLRRLKGGAGGEELRKKGGEGIQGKQAED